MLSRMFLLVSSATEVAGVGQRELGGPLLVTTKVSLARQAARTSASQVRHLAAPPKSGVVDVVINDSERARRVGLGSEAWR